MSRVFRDGITLDDQGGGPEARTLRNEGGLVSVRAQDNGYSGVLNPNRNSIFVKQTAHGFSLGQAVRYDAYGGWVLAQAIPGGDADGVIGLVPDVDTFEVVFGGFLDGFSGLTAGDRYYLSPSTAGEIVNAQVVRFAGGFGGTPPDGRQVDQVLLRALSSTTALVSVGSPLPADAASWGSDRCTNFSPTFAATTGSAPVLYLRNPGVGVLGTKVGALYKVSWAVHFSATVATEPVAIFVDLNDVGAGGGSYLNTGTGLVFTKTVPTPFPVGNEGYSGFAYFIGTGADKIDIDFSAPSALGGTVVLTWGWCEMIRVNSGGDLE